ncbi:MAG: hypothetical protein HY897_09110 [Deltaproteobacteria bacterium]|nr:hypothetical protein [Deltaproteobacteria bacterium]
MRRDEGKPNGATKADGIGRRTAKGLALVAAGASVVVAAACAGNLGAECGRDADCRSDLVCFEHRCMPESVKTAAKEKASALAYANRVREFLASKFGWSTDDAAKRLCVAGETVIIIKDRSNGMVFCLLPDGDGFEVVDFRRPLGDDDLPCGGKVQDLVLGDIINVCLN